MGKKDDMMCAFLSQDHVLLDFFNGALYEGRKQLQPQQIADVQRFYHPRTRTKDGRLRRIRRERDVIKLILINGCWIYLAVENQNSVNPSMPLKCLGYDVDEYMKQLTRLRRKNMEAGVLKTSAEYLSGMRLTDRLIPVITIVLYHGKGFDWNGPHTLQQMLELNGIDEKLRQICAEHHIHVFCLSSLQEEHFETGLRELIGMMKCQNDKQALLDYCQKNQKRLSNMDSLTYDTICTMVGDPALLLHKENCKTNDTEGWDMCQAIRELVKDGEKHGREIGEKIGEKHGREIGEKIGEKQGEEKMSRLILRLTAAGRLDELTQAAQSARVRNRLYREYGI